MKTATAILAEKNKDESISYPLFYTREVMNNGCIEETFALSLQPKGSISFRAAWVIAYIYFNFREDFTFEEALIEHFHTLSHESVKREYAKIVSDLLSTPYKLTQDQEFDIAETAARWLCDAHTKIAVQVHCLDILHKLSHHAWVKEMLNDFMITFSYNASPGLENRLKKISLQMNKTAK